MRARLVLKHATAFATLVIMAVGPACAQGLPPPRPLTESPWNGDWLLSPVRNTAQIRDAAAADYRFHLETDGRIRWEIPSLHEVVEGRTDGQPMTIRRQQATSLTLSVKAEGPRVLLYKVSRNGKPEGEGRMTLIEQDKAWVDLSEPAGRPDLADVIVYVRPDAASK